MKEKRFYLGNYYGSLEIREEKGKCFWGLYGESVDEAEIPRYLFDALEMYHKEYTQRAISIAKRLSEKGYNVTKVSGQYVKIEIESPKVSIEFYTEQLRYQANFGYSEDHNLWLVNNDYTLEEEEVIKMIFEIPQNPKHKKS